MLGQAVPSREVPEPRPRRGHGRLRALQGALLNRLVEVFLVFLRLGLTSFGGPIAHLGYFHRELVERRKWVDEDTYADLVALCQFLPGPASSQVGMSLGIERAGLLGGVAAWVGFTFPSAIALTLFALGVRSQGAWVDGLKVVAVPVVALAIWNMAKTLCPDRPRGAIAILAAIVALAWTHAVSQLAIIGVAGLLGFAIYRRDPVVARGTMRVPISRRASAVAWVAFFALVGASFLPTSNATLQLAGSFYRVGSLVFGGGHVVLPLLEAEVVKPGWTTSDSFVAGYGAAQAVPGPLFSLSAYLGAVIGGWPTALVALVAIFLPSYLLVVGALPFWAKLRDSPAQAVLKGANAGVVGLLVAAFYQPVWTTAIKGPHDFGVALAAFGALSVAKAPPWLVVVLAALVTYLLSLR